MGDNTDVRPPEAGELWHGGFFSFGSGSDRSEPVEPVKLTLDGVFFVDGGFAGPNQLGSWECTLAAAEAHLECSALARAALGKGISPNEFFMQLKTVMGLADADAIPRHPPPPGSKSPDLEPIRKRERQMLAWKLHRMRKTQSDQGILARAAAWADAPLPSFHKL